MSLAGKNRKRLFAMTSLVLAGLLLMRFSVPDSDLSYSLWIDEAGFAVQTSLESAQTGLFGSQIEQLVFSEDDPTHIVAAGPNSTYLSMDNGQTWKPLSHGERVLDGNHLIRWAAGEPLRFAWGGAISSSADGGKSWSRWKDPHAIIVERSVEGDFLVSLSEGTGEEAIYQVDLSAEIPKLGKRVEQRPELSERPIRESIDLDASSAQGHIVLSPTGEEWALTDRGLYSRQNSKELWKSRAEGFHLPSIGVIRQSPLNPSQVAAINTTGQVWQSDNFGELWTPLKSGHFQSL